MKIISVVGARPNFMKIAPLIHAIEDHNHTNTESSKNINHVLVHTGQHYDYDMAQVFFEELGLPKPNHFLSVGSGSHAEQTAKVMIAFEKVCLTEKPDIVVVVGDVNSTLACSLVAKKLNIKVAHVESGLRSGDMEMPEEINRIATDSISDYLLVSEKSGLVNLEQEGKGSNQVHYVGNIMIDTLFYQLKKLDHGDTTSTSTQTQKPYAVLTLHRPSNVDDQNVCQGIIEAICEISKDLQIIFPAHPRTRKNLENFGFIEQLQAENIKILPPLPYNEFLNLWKDAELVLTDSGGIQEETTALGIPCFTIRENTERPITIEEGTNTLVGIDKSNILKAYHEFKSGLTKKGKSPELWDGRSAERIVKILVG